MNSITDTPAEQLSAYIDGELPEAEARFLQRRLEHDPELRALWSRMHLASACIKGQPVRPMARSLPDRVRGQVAAIPMPPVRRPLVRWAMAASIAALAVLSVPRMLHVDQAVVAGATVDQAVVAGHVVASPGSADLVSIRHARPAAGKAISEADAGAGLLAVQRPASPKSSPLPLTEQSPSDFPLVETGDKRSWPRSQLVAGSDEPALEAYLVRHNQMLASDGLGGFVPYVDVVTSDQPATTAKAGPGDDRAAEAAGQ